MDGAEGPLRVLSVRASRGVVRRRVRSSWVAVFICCHREEREVPMKYYYSTKIIIIIITFEKYIQFHPEFQEEKNEVDLYRCI
jgi:hypothetical protein